MIPYSRTSTNPANAGLVRPGALHAEASQRSKDITWKKESFVVVRLKGNEPCIHVTG
jgi:hypothetical protein